MLFVFAAGIAVASAGCPLFEIHRTGAKVEIVRSEVPAGQTEVLPIGKDGFVSVVVPLQPGQASDFVKTSAGGMLIARCSGDSLRLMVQRPGAAQREILAKPLAELAHYRISLSITAWDGAKGRFAITGWNRVAPEPGPVVDLFGGKIPMQAGDYSISADIKEVALGPVFRGAAPLELVRGHWFARGRIGDGPEGWYVVDLAAGMTTVAASALRGAVASRAATTTVASAEGTASTAASITGAGGSVGGGFRTSAPVTLQVGSIAWSGVELAVLDSLPAVGGRAIDGILGIDLLARGERVSIAPPREGEGGELALGGDAPAVGDVAPIGFSRIGDLAAVAVVADGTPGWLVLDSGSPFTVLGSGFTLRPSSRPVTDAPRGLDGARLQLGWAIAGTLTVGPHTLRDVELRQGDLPVLQKFGDRSHAGLIGSDLLGRFGAIHLDFPAQRLWLMPRSGARS